MTEVHVLLMVVPRTSRGVDDPVPMPEAPKRSSMSSVPAPEAPEQPSSNVAVNGQPGPLLGLVRTSEPDRRQAAELAWAEVSPRHHQGRRQRHGLCHQLLLRAGSPVLVAERQESPLMESCPLLTTSDRRRSGVYWRRSWCWCGSGGRRSERGDAARRGWHHRRRWRGLRSGSRLRRWSGCIDAPSEDMRDSGSHGRQRVR